MSTKIENKYGEVILEDNEYVYYRGWVSYDTFLQELKTKNYNKISYDPNNNFILSPKESENIFYMLKYKYIKEQNEINPYLVGIN
jgi:hypothetical protein